MSPDLRTGRRRGRVVPGTGAALALVGLLVLGGPAAAVAPTDPTDPTMIAVEGTLLQLVVEQSHREPSTELEVRTVVEVGTVLLTVPQALPEVVGRTGDEVTVVLQAPAGLGLDAALDEAAVPEADDVARVVEVLVTPTPPVPAGDEQLARGVIGLHSLVVLPVYWSTPDGATVASLQAAAARTTAYWSEQSGGRIAVSTQVRGWASIADPGTCDTEAIWSRALAAHGVSAPTGDQHVLVYFPHQESCGGWAGMASLGGGRIWVNGYPYVDVWAHEFGHNLGLGHANLAVCASAGTRVSLTLPISGCSVTEYGDRADVMGGALTLESGNLNSAMADFLGLAAVQRVATGTTTVVELQPLASVNAVRSVAVPVVGGTVYVDFRPATGRDVRMPAWAGVQVHLRTSAAAGAPTTYLLDMVPGTVTPFTSPALPAGAAWAIPGTTQVLSVTSVGATATVSVGPTGLVAPTITSYVSRVYRDLFDRGVDPEGMATWSAALASGVPRIAVANAITASDEYRLGLIARSYRTYLGREADASGRLFWLARMAGGMTIQQLEAGFVASDEYYARAGSNDGWVRRLYADVLGREPSSSEVASWLGAVAAGTRRFDVGLGFLLSTEHLTTAVDAVYLDVLGRSIDPTGRQTWVTAIQAGTRFEQVIGGIVASEEYYGRG